MQGEQSPDGDEHDAPPSSRAPGQYQPYPVELVKELDELTVRRHQALEGNLHAEVMEVQPRIDALVRQLRTRLTPREGDVVLGTRLKSVVGSGSFGTVWAAEDLERPGRVAVKIFSESRLSDGLAVHQFRRGIRFMRRLDQDGDRPPSVIKMHRADEADLAFVMDLCGKIDLRNAIRGWDEATKVQIFTTICEAVRFAHSKQVLHRDIKPRNILMRDDGKPVLSDFDISDLEFTTTVSAAAHGAPIYTAPEHLQNPSLRSRLADVYSLGRVLHYLLRQADPPFVLSRVPELEDLADHPRGLVRIVRKCTLFDPKLRYQRVDELLEDLARYHTAPDAVGVERGDLRGESGLASQVPAEPARPPARTWTSTVEAATKFLRTIPGLLSAAAAVVAAVVALSHPQMKPDATPGDAKRASPSITESSARVEPGLPELTGDGTKPSTAALPHVPTEMSDQDSALKKLEAQILARTIDVRSLAKADLHGSHLMGAELENANLTGAVLIEADLRGATLSRANLRSATLDRADLQGADINGADLRGASLECISQMPQEDDEAG